MEFKINDLVFILKTKEKKKIIDCEIIHDCEIYYMNDKTSYNKEQIIKENHIKIDDFLSKKPENIEIVLDNTIKKITQGFSKLWRENKKYNF